MNNIKLYAKMNIEIVKHIFKDQRNSPVRYDTFNDGECTYFYYTITGFDLRIMPYSMFKLHILYNDQHYKRTEFMHTMCNFDINAPLTDCRYTADGDLILRETDANTFVLDHKRLAFYGDGLSLYRDQKNANIIHINKGGVYVGFVLGKILPKSQAEEDEQ